MAKTKVQSIAHMTTGNVADDTRLYFAVMSDEFAEANGVVAIEGSPTMAEKVFVQVRYRVGNDLDATMENQNSEWRQVSAANYSGLGAGFLGDLKEIFDTERTTLGLDPV
jgi:hypothetical protein